MDWSPILSLMVCIHLACDSLDVFTLTNDNYSVCERDITRPVDRQLFHNPPNYGEEGEYQWKYNFLLVFMFSYETYSNIHKDKSEDPNSSAYYGGGIEVLNLLRLLWNRMSIL